MKVTDMASENLIKNIRLLANQSGLPLSTVENRCGLCRGFLSRYKTGGINLSTAVRLANYFQASLDDLIVDMQDATATEHDREKRMAKIDMQIAKLYLARAELISKN